jgi:phenylpyruvate tautomerase PptA (4-oxalocrotonate tautomerase family)
MNLSLRRKSEQQKSRLAQEIVKDVIEVLKYGEDSVSVAMEEVRPQIGLKRSTTGHSEQPREAIQKTRIHDVKKESVHELVF